MTSSNGLNPTSQIPQQAHTELHDEVDRALIKAALAQTQGNQLRAAERLGINRITLKTL